MKIDIITYTESQFAVLNEEQILAIMEAQQKKDGLTTALAEKKRKEKYRLLKNGAIRSKVYEKICAELDAKYLAEVEYIRESLLFFLRYSGKPSDETVSNSPYPVDYSLSEADRYRLVQNYYMNTYSDPQERFTAFKADNVAKAYLGEWYPTLHDSLLYYVEQG